MDEWNVIDEYSPPSLPLADDELEFAPESREVSFWSSLSDVVYMVGILAPQRPEVGSPWIDVMDAYTALNQLIYSREPNVDVIDNALERLLIALQNVTVGATQVQQLQDAKSRICGLMSRPVDLALCTDATGELDTLPVQLPNPRTIDLNALYAEKCTPRDPLNAPWGGSLLCNLGNGGSFGRLVNSVRFVPNRSGGYDIESVVMTMIEMMRDIDTKLNRFPTLVQQYTPLIRKFRELYQQLLQRVEAGNPISVDDFEPLMDSLVYLLEFPPIRIMLTPLLRDYNVSILDYV